MSKKSKWWSLGYSPTSKACVNNQNLVVVTSGLNLDSSNFLLNFIKILHGAFPGKILVTTARVPLSEGKPFSERILIKQLMPGNENRKLGILSRIARDLLTQLTISYAIAKEKKAEVYIFFLAQSLILPILILKLLRRKIIIATGASYSEVAKFRKDYLLLIPKIEEKISYRLADHIVIYSKNLVVKWRLEKYRHNISIAHEHFLDFDKFKIQKKFDERENLVGYIGRLSEE
ncbi:MAG: hypothetical protein KAU17_10760, partial [Spirochaetales bacterium]|nr:hypothetical protein [Spirochaetales bacterium]